MPRIDEPVDAEVVDALYRQVAEFRRAYDPDGLTVEEFDAFGATRRTLRQFLTAAADLDALVRDVLLPDPDKEKDGPVTVTVGVIGTGMIGTLARPPARPITWRGRPSPPSSTSPPTARPPCAQEVGAIAARLLERCSSTTRQVDAVLIASPGDLHAEQVLACLAAGKPVLCEKPLATTADDALKVVHAEVAARTPARPGRLHAPLRRRVPRRQGRHRRRCHR